ncbi:hypothetical protein L0Z64_04790 [Phaeobacter sp. BS23]
MLSETKYPFKAMLRFATDALTGFSTKPLKMATRLAFVSLLVTVLMAIYVFGSLILFNTVAGWASVLLAISFFSAIQLLTLGILGEYVGRLYMESKQRPLYFLSQETGHPSAHAVDFTGDSRSTTASPKAPAQKEAS